MPFVSGVFIVPDKITYIQAEEQTIEQKIGNEVLIKIAQCESGLRQQNPDGSVLRGRQNPKDVGLFQINEDYWLEESKKVGYDIYTTDGNIAMAKYIYEKRGTRDWGWSKPCHKQ